MKKYIIIAAAAIAAMACSRVETPDAQREINFTVANRVQTKADTYATTNTFGTYAWYTANDASVTAQTGSDHAAFMVNEEVGYTSSVWKTLHNTFYWPKTGSIDFISYSPFNGTNNDDDSNPAVTEDKITYTGINVAALDANDQPLNIDYMYADKVNCAINANTTPAQQAVPTVFRHALAKLSFKIKANFVEYEDATNNSTTSWEVTVTSAKVSGFKTTGNCELNLNSDKTTWDKPVTLVANLDYDPNDDSKGPENYSYNVWTNLSGESAEQELIDATNYPNGVLLTTSAQEINAATGFVMPQMLAVDTQKLKLTIHIKTTLANNRVIEEDYTPTLDIVKLSSLKAWEMNQNIVYTIQIKPVAYVSTYDNPNDVIITFNPSVADWTNVDATATIQL